MKALHIEEVTEPNLFGAEFPHSEPPHIKFDGTMRERLKGKEYVVDPGLVGSSDIHITDTTFRDGQQARPPYTTEQIKTLYKLLSKLGGPNGVIRQTEFFVYSDKDREAVEECRQLGNKYPEITGWIRAEPADLHLVHRVGLNETGMLTSCSDYHIFHKLKLDRKKAFEKYTGLAKEALSKGIRPRCHLEDVTRADFDGFVLPFVQELMRISEEVEESQKIKIRLCDTMGFGLSYPGATLPRSVPKNVLAMIHLAGVPRERLEWHGHNDFHKVMINGTTAWIYGCNSLNCTLLGIGERTGNPPVEGAIFEYIGLKGESCGINTQVITEIAEYFRSIGVRIPQQAPFVGEDFVKTRAGIHAGGLAQDERIYNIFDTVKLLSRKPHIVLTDKSGTEGVHFWVNNYLGLSGKNMIKRTKLARIMKWVADQYNLHGRTTAISDEEMVALVEEHLGQDYAQTRRQAPIF